MGYLHIANLYRPEAQCILDFKEVYALEKIHGTSAHVAIDEHGTIRLFSGGEPHDKFQALFGASLPPLDALSARLTEQFKGKRVTVYGEAYGGKCQGMSKTYGPSLRFVAFDVKVQDGWLQVQHAERVVTSLGLEFVHYERGPSDLQWLDEQRDRASTQAVRNGIQEPCISEGIVIRPPFEVTLWNGERVIAKHKRAEFNERKTIPNVDPAQRELMERADQIAEEFVTEMRLSHVLDKLGNPADFQSTGAVIKAMVEDVCREASGEIVDSKPVRKAVAAKAAELYKLRLTTIVRE